MHESESLDLELLISSILNIHKENEKTLQLVKNFPLLTAMKISEILYLKNSKNYRNSEQSNEFYT